MSKKDPLVLIKLFLYKKSVFSLKNNNLAKSHYFKLPNRKFRELGPKSVQWVGDFYKFVTKMIYFRHLSSAWKFEIYTLLFIINS